MENKVLSITELKDLLNTEDYTFRPVEKHHIKEFERINTWADESTFRLFDIMTHQAGGKPPKQDDYLDEAVKRTKAFWFKDSPMGRIKNWRKENGGWAATYLTWNGNIEKAVRWRLSRMYQSYIAEYSASCILHTLYPHFTLLASYELDLVAGVDLAVVDNKTSRAFYIHVTKNSPYALKNIDSKGNKKSFYKDKNGNKHYWQRSFTGAHTVYAYDMKNSERSEEVNGHYLFKEDYIRNLTEQKLAENNLDVIDSNQNNELLRFHRFLQKEKIVADGINSMIITFKKNTK